MNRDTIQRIELNCHLQDKNLAIELQEKVSELSKSEIPQIIEEEFSKYNFEDQSVFINQILIDIGNIDLENFKNDFLNKFREALIKELENTLKSIESNESSEFKKPKQATDLDAFEFYLENGFFPWWFHTDSNFNFETFVEKAIITSTSEIKRILLKIAPDLNAVKRLLNGISEQLIFKIFGLLKSGINLNSKHFNQLCEFWSELPIHLSIPKIDVYAIVFFNLSTSTSQTNVFSLIAEEIKLLSQNYNVEFDQFSPFYKKLLPHLKIDQQEFDLWIETMSKISSVKKPTENLSLRQTEILNFFEHNLRFENISFSSYSDIKDFLISQKSDKWFWEKLKESISATNQVKNILYPAGFIEFLIENFFPVKFKQIIEQIEIYNQIFKKIFKNAFSSVGFQDIIKKADSIFEITHFEAIDIFKHFLVFQANENKKKIVEFFKSQNKELSQFKIDFENFNKLEIPLTELEISEPKDFELSIFPDNFYISMIFHYISFNDYPWWSQEFLSQYKRFLNKKNLSTTDTYIFSCLIDHLILSKSEIFIIQFDDFITQTNQAEHLFLHFEPEILIKFSSALQNHKEFEVFKRILDLFELLQPYAVFKLSHKIFKKWLPKIIALNLENIKSESPKNFVFFVFLLILDMDQIDSATYEKLEAEFQKIPEFQDFNLLDSDKIIAKILSRGKFKLIEGFNFHFLKLSELNIQNLIETPENFVHFDYEGFVENFKNSIESVPPENQLKELKQAIQNPQFLEFILSKTNDELVEFILNILVKGHQDRFKSLISDFIEIFKRIAGARYSNQTFQKLLIRSLVGVANIKSVGEDIIITELFNELINSLNINEDQFFEIFTVLQLEIEASDLSIKESIVFSWLIKRSKIFNKLSTSSHSQKFTESQYDLDTIYIWSYLQTQLPNHIFEKLTELVLELKSLEWPFEKLSSHFFETIVVSTAYQESEKRPKRDLNWLFFLEDIFEQIAIQLKIPFTEILTLLHIDITKKLNETKGQQIKNIYEFLDYKKVLQTENDLIAIKKGALNYETIILDNSQTFDVSKEKFQILTNILNNKAIPTNIESFDEMFLIEIKDLFTQNFDKPVQVLLDDSQYILYQFAQHLNLSTIDSYLFNALSLNVLLELSKISKTLSAENHAQYIVHNILIQLSKILNIESETLLLEFTSYLKNTSANNFSSVLLQFDFLNLSEQDILPFENEKLQAEPNQIAKQLVTKFNKEVLFSDLMENYTDTKELIIEELKERNIFDSENYLIQSLKYFIEFSVMPWLHKDLAFPEFDKKVGKLNRQTIVQSSNDLYLLFENLLNIKRFIYHFSEKTKIHIIKYLIKPEEKVLEFYDDLLKQSKEIANFPTKTIQEQIQFFTLINLQKGDLLDIVLENTYLFIKQSLAVEHIETINKVFAKYAFKNTLVSTKAQQPLNEIESLKTSWINEIRKVKQLSKIHIDELVPLIQNFKPMRPQASVNEVSEVLTNLIFSYLDAKLLGKEVKEILNIFRKNKLISAEIQTNILNRNEINQTVLMISLKDFLVGDLNILETDEFHFISYINHELNTGSINEFFSSLAIYLSVRDNLKEENFLNIIESEIYDEPRLNKFLDFNEIKGYHFQKITSEKKEKIRFVFEIFLLEKLLKHVFEKEIFISKFSATLAKSKNEEIVLLESIGMVVKSLKIDPSEFIEEIYHNISTSRYQFNIIETAIKHIENELINLISQENDIELFEEDNIKNIPEKAQKANEQLINDFLKTQDEEEKYFQLSQEKLSWIDNKDEMEKIYVENAGLVLLWPFLTKFFKNIELFGEKGFVNIQAQKKAVQILQFLATGETKTYEYQLGLNKILCGLELKFPVDYDMEITQKEIEESENLLKAVIQNWDIIKNTSIEGFRETFLNRKGMLFNKNVNWHLKVEEKGVDVLLKKIPWGFETIKMSYNKYIIFVEWNY